MDIDLLERKLVDAMEEQSKMFRRGGMSCYNKDKAQAVIGVLKETGLILKGALDVAASFPYSADGDAGAYLYHSSGGPELGLYARVLGDHF